MNFSSILFTIVRNRMSSFWWKRTWDQSEDSTNLLQRVRCSPRDKISRFEHVLMYSFMSSAYSWARRGEKSWEIFVGKTPVGCLNCLSIPHGLGPSLLPSPLLLLEFSLVLFDASAFLAVSIASFSSFTFFFTASLLSVISWKFLTMSSISFSFFFPFPA